MNLKGKCKNRNRLKEVLMVINSVLQILPVAWNRGRFFNTRILLLAL